MKLKVRLVEAALGCVFTHITIVFWREDQEDRLKGEKVEGEFQLVSLSVLRHFLDSLNEPVEISFHEACDPKSEDGLLVMDIVARHNQRFEGVSVANDEQEHSGVLAKNLEVGHFFIRFPEPGQLNRPLLKMLFREEYSDPILHPSRKSMRVKAINIVTGELEFVALKEAVLIIHL